MKSRSHATTKGHSGFGLVEVMVAMVIGMLGIIVMMQVFAVAEGQKRSTTGTGDAQSNGAMALYTLQRDIRQGGYGFSSDKVLGCALALPAPASRTLAHLAPVIIKPADVPDGDLNTDTLLIAYGNNEGSPEGDVITLVTGSQLGVTTPTNFRPGHWVIAAPSGPTTGCSLALATVTSVAAPNVTVENSGAATDGFLFNLGASPRIIAYAIRSGNLTVCDYMASDCSLAANYAPITSNIVSLRAQYGHTSTAGSGVDWDQTTPDTACGWVKVSALRIVVVARNSQPEKRVRDANNVEVPVTVETPYWMGSDAVAAAIDSGAAAAASFDLPSPTSTWPTWQDFRYKVFQTVIPIRNLPWMKSESCP